MNQIQWEERLYNEKKQAILDKLNKKRNGGHYGTSKQGERILIQQLEDVSAVLEERVKETRKKEALRKYIVRRAATRVNKDGELYCDYDAISYIGLTTLLSKVFHHSDTNNKLTYISERIGAKIEIDQRLHLFTKKFKAVRHLIGEEQRQLIAAKQKVHSYEARMVFSKWDRLMENQWEDWTTQEKIWVGSEVVYAILNTMPDYLFLNTVKVVGKPKPAYIVDTTEEFRDFIKEYDEFLSEDYMSGIPCIEPPQDWVANANGEITGGYHSPLLQLTNPFCKIKNSTQRSFLHTHTPTLHITALNYMQSIEWEINTDGLEIVRYAIQSGIVEDIPCMYMPKIGKRPKDKTIEERKEWGRQALLQYKENERNTKKLLYVQRVVSMAEQLKGKPIWFVYDTCFRGRAYCSSSTLNTQGRDFVKSLLRFREGKPLGDAGLKWLAVHGANLYGHNKISYTDRYRWVLDNHESICAVAQSLYNSRSENFISAADKPCQFYAFCMEWSNAHSLREPTEYVSHLPVGLDGSGNGFQHIWSLLRNEKGASWVNLVKSDTPQDIYKRFHTKLNTVLEQDTDNEVARVLYGKLPKSLIKQLILTIPYGITRRGMSVLIGDHLLAHWKEFPALEKDAKVLWQYSIYITDIVADISKEMLKEATELMTWLKLVCKKLSDEKKQLKWISPVGFPVCHNYRFQDMKPIITAGVTKNIELKMAVPNERVNIRKAYNAVTANYIHSLDSSHMVLTAVQAKKRGLTSSYIHDEFTTHACDVPEMFQLIRDTFAELYIPDNLESFRRIVSDISGVELPEPPQCGTYDINDIYDATYFFG